MADWRQIQARIRKAKTSSDPAAQLAELYERTRDAMVAFELAAWHEKAGNAAETVQWYTTAALRFRRAQWRTKAEEALTRLGAPIPEPGPVTEPHEEPGREGSPQLVRPASPQAARGLPYMSSTEAEGGQMDAGEDLEQSPLEAQGPADESAAPGAAESTTGGAATQKRRRRGRRGGRKRRGRGGAAQGATAEGAPRMSRPAGPAAVTSSAAGRFHPVPARPFSPGPSQLGPSGAAFPSDPGTSETEDRPFDSAPGGPFGSAQDKPESELEPPPVRERSYETPFETQGKPFDAAQGKPATSTWSGSVRRTSTQVPSGLRAGRASGGFATTDSAELAAGSSAGLMSSRSRAGDPGLSSRIAQLESQLRRMLACPLSSLEEADQAPAGPGVLLLSDSDQVTHYYIEACQTLRIGIGNLLRGGRGSKGASHLKPSLAEHLGISESRVSKYMKDHCAVRWIQLDEGAPELAHFAMAVLRPVVTE